MEDEESLKERQMQKRQESWIRNHTCKQCGKNPRRNGSRTCEQCAKIFHIHRADENRLQRKVEAQAKITN